MNLHVMILTMTVPIPFTKLVEVNFSSYPSGLHHPSLYQVLACLLFLWKSIDLLTSQQNHVLSIWVHARGRSGKSQSLLLKKPTTGLQFFFFEHLLKHKDNLFYLDSQKNRNCPIKKSHDLCTTLDRRT